MSISSLDQIIKWSSTLPTWQSEAVRRLLLKIDLGQDDEKELLLMLKSDFGLADAAQVPKAKILDGKQFSSTRSSDLPVLIKKMKGLQGVNALPHDSILNFAPKGLTIVYGDNGAGKSGYARVLKRACRARDSSEPILSNVFDDTSPGPAQALFAITVNGKIDKEITWIDEQDENEILSSICVFDAGCARIIVDQKNQAHYLPYGAHVFEGLANLIQHMRECLEQEKPKPEKPVLEGLDPTTKAGIFLISINRSTNPQDIQDNTKWKEEDQKRLDELTKEIANAEANDPLKQAGQFERCSEKLKSIARQMLGLRAFLSSAVYGEIQHILYALKEAEKALKIASNLTLSNEPLPGAGSNAWQMLYNTAKKFSMEHAYPNEKFPHLDNNTKCVLCMQPLGAEAKERFSRFKAFMEDTTKQKVEGIQETLARKKEEIEKLQFPDNGLLKERLQDIAEIDDKLPNKVCDYFNSLRTRQQHFLQVITERKSFETPALLNCPKRELQSIDKILKSNIQKLQKSAKPEELKKLKNEKLELQAKKLISTQTSKLKEYVDQLRLAHLYEMCIKKLNPRKITMAGKEIISKTLSPQLEKALADELRFLGASSFPICFRISGRHGSTEHQFHLEGANIKKGCFLSQILSEGEQKIIALAGFLAELQTSSMKNPIIFDDPVCSLDHKFRRAIAKRLAKEGKERQVILFTHDLPFVLMLNEYCDESGCEWTINSIERTAKTPGICTKHPPWYALNLKARVGILRDELQVIRKTHTSAIESEYKAKVRSFYGKLRETWERLVEELLLNGVIHRFGRDVQTQRIKPLSDISDADVKRVFKAMKICSCYIHDEAAELNEPLPTPEVIELDIKNLEEYRLELSSKRKRSPRK